jgi:cell cycle sensor histidine kinase DivJ
MRSLKFFGSSEGQMPAFAGTGNRPENLRRKTIANNARILMVISVLSMVPAMPALIGGAALPFILATLMLAGAMMSLSLQQKGLFNMAALSQAALLLLAGLLLTIADQKFADGGLAVALMGPVLAALVAPRDARRLSWAGLALVIVLALVAAPLGLSGVEAERQLLAPASVLAFLAALSVVAYSAHRINAAYEV